MSKPEIEPATDPTNLAAESGAWRTITTLKAEVAAERKLRKKYATDLVADNALIADLLAALREAIRYHDANSDPENLAAVEKGWVIGARTAIAKAEATR